MAGRRRAAPRVRGADGPLRGRPHPPRRRQRPGHHEPAHNTVFDDTLTRFGAALDGRSTTTDAFIDDWSADTRATMARLAEAGLRYANFLTDWGHDTRRHTTAHTLTTNALYSTCQADGIPYADWVRRNVIDDEALSLGAHLLH